MPRSLRAALLLLCLLPFFGAGGAHGKESAGTARKENDSRAVPAAGPSAAGTARKENDSRAEFARYKKRAKELSAWHEKEPLDEKPVMELLKADGLFETSLGARGFRPFKVRVYNGLFRWPLHAGIVSSEYGRRWKKRHEGIDLAADEGVPVCAAAGGTVLYAGDGLRGYGNVVILRHDQRTTTLYAHNRRLLVAKGQQVAAGEPIAELGSTGHSTGPHVHFEFRVKGKAVNPRAKLIPNRYWNRG
ncbi:MAG: M23 family metallopeptidase [Elusimicrobiota bacterium]